MIRQATAHDLPKLETCAREFYASSRHLRGFDMARFTSAWTNFIETGIGVIFLLLDEEEVIGTIGGIQYPDLYSGELIATEFFWFVREGHRGRGIRLYQQFEQWARERKCSQLRMVHLMDSMPEALLRTYTRLGFQPAEIHYSKEIL